MKAISISEMSGSSMWSDRYYGSTAMASKSRYQDSSYHHHHRHLHPMSSLSSSSSNTSLGSTSSYSSSSSEDYNNNNNNNNNNHKAACRTRSSSSRLCRTLFGPSDPSENKRLVREEFHSRRESDTSRWNFDFSKEKPMAGRYEWSKALGGGSRDNLNKKSTGFQSIWASSGGGGACKKSPKKSYQD